MLLTNKLGLPQSLVKAIQNDPYSKGDSDYTATSLLKPARMIELERIHADKITEDASDRIWSLVGQVGHSILERCSDADITEQRLFSDIPFPMDQSRPVRKISGQLDLEHQTKIIDFKFTSAYAVKSGHKDEHEQQVNIGRWLCHKNGITVNSMEIIAILRDWSKLEAKRDWQYPQQQVVVFNIPVWSYEETEQFILSRVTEIEQAKTKLPMCSDYERWAKPEKWAVMKKGRVRAVKLYNNEHDALSHSMTGAGLTVEHRPGENIRCESYCRVAGFCSWWQEKQKQ